MVVVAAQMILSAGVGGIQGAAFVCLERECPVHSPSNIYFPADTSHPSMAPIIAHLDEYSHLLPRLLALPLTLMVCSPRKG